MLGDITIAQEVYIVCGYTDMRKSIDGLAVLVKQRFQMDPYKPALYLFCGRSCNRMKQHGLALSRATMANWVIRCAEDYFKPVMEHLRKELIRKANPYRRMAASLKTNTYAENLVKREFEEHGARKILLTDITYLPYQDTFAYLSTVIDTFTKQVLAYVLSDNLKLDFVLLTIEQLVKNHGISLSSETIIHSDQGVHYTSYKFIEIVTNSNLRQSMSRRGNCWDNAPQESFFGHMKDEIDLSSCICFNDVKILIDDWIDYYNNDRYQWQIAKLSPNEYYEYITTGVYPLNFQTES